MPIGTLLDTISNLILSRVDFINSRKNVCAANTGEKPNQVLLDFRKTQPSSQNEKQGSVNDLVLLICKISGIDYIDYR